MVKAVSAGTVVLQLILRDDVLQDVSDIFTVDSYNRTLVVDSDEVMRNTGAFIQKGSAEWENQVFQRAKTGVRYRHSTHILS